MYVIKNSARALLLALIPLAIAEVALLAFALAGGQVLQPADVPQPDQVVVQYAGRMAINAALLFAGHCMLRPFAVSSRIAYSLMGGVMAAASYAIAIRNHLQLSSPEDGTVMTIGLLPTFAGMISGFLYGQIAGIAPAARFPKHTYEGLATSLAFDGPVRVRTSMAGIGIAAVIPAVLTAAPFVMALPLIRLGFGKQVGATIFAALLPTQIFVTTLIVTVIPSVIFMLCLHYVARAMHHRGILHYVVLGAVMALGFVLLVSSLVPMAGMALVPATFCGATMGAIYRRFAGLEPVPLPEAVIAPDINALVGADHPSRHQHGVVLSR